MVPAIRSPPLVTSTALQIVAALQQLLPQSSFAPPGVRPWVDSAEEASLTLLSLARIKLMGVSNRVIIPVTITVRAVPGPCLPPGRHLLFALVVRC